jgi:hypothetical protein
MRSNATPPYLPQDIRGLHEAYATGLDPRTRAGRRRTVDDAWTVYEVIAGKDEEDPFSRPIALGRLGAVPLGRR